MIEPVFIGSHSAYLRQPEMGAKHIVFNCGNGFGLSAITATGPRWSMSADGHGFYCGPDTYEVLIIENFEFDDKLNSPTGDIPENAEPKGWVSIEELGQLAQDVADKGKDGWPCWNTPWVDDEDD